MLGVAHKCGIPRTLGPAIPQLSLVWTRATVARNRGIGGGASSLVSDFLTDCIVTLDRSRRRGTNGGVLGKVDFMVEQGGLRCGRRYNGDLAVVSFLLHMNATE